MLKKISLEALAVEFSELSDSQLEHIDSFAEALVYSRKMLDLLVEDGGDEEDAISIITFLFVNANMHALSQAKIISSDSEFSDILKRVNNLMPCQ